MRRFFTDKKLTVGTEIVLDGEEAKHIMTVLRMKPGDDFAYQRNRQGNDCAYFEREQG